MSASMFARLHEEQQQYQQQQQLRGLGTPEITGVGKPQTNSVRSQSDGTNMRSNHQQHQHQRHQQQHTPDMHRRTPHAHPPPESSLRRSQTTGGGGGGRGHGRGTPGRTNAASPSDWKQLAKLSSKFGTASIDTTNVDGSSWMEQRRAKQQQQEEEHKGLLEKQRLEEQEGKRLRRKSQMEALKVRIHSSTCYLPTFVVPCVLDSRTP